MGFVIIIALALYFLISIGVVTWAISYAKKNGKRVMRWGWGAAFIMFLIPFWDWMPTVVAHKYYCATEAGFWVYKTPEQWMEENPGVMETLISNKGQVRDYVKGDNNSTRTSYMNQRFIYITKSNGRLPFNRWRVETQIVDGVTKDVLAREIAFTTSQERRGGGWSGWKFWLDSGFTGSRNCRIYAHQDSGGMSPIIHKLEGK